MSTQHLDQYGPFAGIIAFFVVAALLLLGTCSTCVNGSDSAPSEYQQHRDRHEQSMQCSKQKAESTYNCMKRHGLL